MFEVRTSKYWNTECPYERAEHGEGAVMVCIMVVRTLALGPLLLLLLATGCCWRLGLRLTKSSRAVQ
jgi:hypothetical protein